MLKKKLIHFLAILLLFVYPFSLNAQNQRDFNRFFGWHFDFHATADDSLLGKDFDKGLLDTFLMKTQPDFIQVDSKGHPGYSSYPTKVGYSNHSFVRDPMKIWENETNKYGVDLYVHHSNFLDDKALAENPRWSRMNADGSRDLSTVGYLSGYFDSLLIPQLKELIDNYGIKGVWLDGGVWATGLDYSPKVKAEFLKQTGYHTVPIKKDEPHYEEWVDFNRLLYRKVTKHIIKSLHDYDPGFRICLNWAFSDYMPFKVDEDVDFLSGDLSGRNSVNKAAFKARFYSMQNIPWDLMSWGMVNMGFAQGLFSRKSLVQLEQEAAETFSKGGGFQVYFQQNRDASFRTLDVDALSQLAHFARERQPYCENNVSVPQIGLWYSVADWRKHSDDAKRPFGWSSIAVQRLNTLFMDCQYSTDILIDDVMEEKMEKYPIIVIPESTFFNPELKERLIKYVKKGGNLIIIGGKTVRQFKDMLNVSFEGKDTASTYLIGDKDLGGVIAVKANWQPVLAKENTKIFGHFYTQNDYRYAKQYPVATINHVGKGKVAAIYVDLSSPYYYTQHPVMNNLIADIIENIDSKKELIHVEGSDKVHIALGEKDNQLLIHLINSAGNHEDDKVIAYNELRPTPPLTIHWALDSRPKSVKLQPEDKNLFFEYKSGKIDISVPPVDVYSIVEITF